MYYRTRTYLAGDWDGDNNLISTIQKWNHGERWELSFSDAHDLMQARDSSFPCSIKKSLSQRLDGSNTFVLIVGNKTKEVTKGSCQHCDRYSAYTRKCTNNGYTDYRSFVEYECEKAARAASNGLMRIIVIYNYTRVYKEKCPEPVRYMGIHIPGILYYDDGSISWNYNAIKKAIMG